MPWVGLYSSVNFTDEEAKSTLSITTNFAGSHSHFLFRFLFPRISVTQLTCLKKQFLQQDRLRNFLEEKLPCLYLIIVS